MARHQRLLLITLLFRRCYRCKTHAWQHVLSKPVATGPTLYVPRATWTSSSFRTGTDRTWEQAVWRR